MSELDDRLHEGRQTVATMRPPEDLWARVVERSNEDDAAVLDLTIAPQHRRRHPRWLAVAACLLAVVAVAAVVIADRQTVDTIDPSVSPTTTEAPADGSSTLAKGEGELVGRPLTIDAVERDGEVSGELRVGSVVVTIQCAGTRGFTIEPSGDQRRDLILGGQVTENPDDVAVLDEVSVAVGDLVALIIREDRPELGQRITLYESSLWHGEDASSGSCDDLVESVPLNLDGGFFNGGVGDGIETG